MKGERKGSKWVNIMTKGTVITINFAENSDKLATVVAVLDAMGIKYGMKKVDMPRSEEKVENPGIKAKDEPKKAEKKVAEPKKAPKKSSKKAEPKTSDEFNRDLYVKCANALDVVGKHGVYKFARKTVYDAMSEVEKSKSHRLTKNVLKSLKAQLLTVAQTEGIQWYIDKVAQA